MRSGPIWSALSLPHLQDPNTAAMMSILKVPASPSPGPARFLNLSFVAGALRSERVRVCSWPRRHQRDSPRVALLARRWRARGVLSVRGSYAIDATRRDGVEGKKRTPEQTGEQSEKSRTPKRRFGRSADVRCAWAVGLILRDLRKSLSQACVAVAVSAMKGTPGKKERNCPSLR